MSDASFDTAFAALTDIYDDTHDLVTADVSGGRFAIASPGFALTDLVGFVASVFGHDDAIPDWIPRGVRLTELELQRDPTTSEFSCSFTVAADDVDWVIIEGMAVTGASLAVEVGADGVRGVVGGSMRIEQVELAVEIEIPDQIMTTHVHTVSDEVGFLSGNGLLPPVGAGRHPSASPSLVDLSL